jgi:hypothetical protein
MKIYVKLFDKEFDVKASNKAVRSALKMQLEFAKMNNKMNNTADKDATDVFSTQIAVIDEAESFMKNVLKLTKKQAESLDDMDFQETMSAVGYICDRMMGMSDEQIKADTEKVREDPKK